MGTRQPPSAKPSERLLLEAMPQAAYALDLQRRITHWNPAAERLTGHAASGVLGRSCRDGILNHVDDEGTPLCGTRCPLLATMTDGAPREARVFLHHNDGHRLPVRVHGGVMRDADGNICGAVESFTDDSRARDLDQELGLARNEALTDSLTGLANRRMLHRLLDHHSDEFRRYQRSFAVLFVDIDSFKKINDLHGHPAGDRLLRLVASTLDMSTRPSDTVGRWGGEEFLILAPADDGGEALRLAERARRLVCSSWIDDDGRRVRVTVSIGAALVRPGETAGELIDRADAAMFAAKRKGRNCSHLA